jgi:hypothetical protein
MALDEDALAVGLLDDGQRQGPFGLARLPGVVAVDVAGAEPLADDHGHDNEQQPAEHGDLAVPDGPAGHSFHDGNPGVLRFAHGSKTG